MFDTSDSYLVDRWREYFKRDTNESLLYGMFASLLTYLDECLAENKEFDAAKIKNLVENIKTVWHQ